MLFGAELRPNGVRFRLFAPAAQRVGLRIKGAAQDIAMAREAEGWFEQFVPEARAGALYNFVLEDGTIVPDPVARFQPRDVHGPSEVIDPEQFRWTDAAWRGCPWSQTVLYEMHIGTFTPEGTFAAATEKLEELARIGITAIEIMCLADFAGLRNWGYDSVLLYAPDSSYGRPEDLKQFVDTAHRHGIQVVLDVVYNHFGPEGNYLPRYFPQMLTSEHCTPWGDALNFDEESSGSCAKQVRELIIQNALYWVEEFHIDGLRLDASHTILDNSPLHVLDEMAERVRELADSLNGRRVHLIREDEHNIAPELKRTQRGKAKRFTAQWNHDMSHLLGAGMRTVFDEPADGSPDDETRRISHAVAEGYILAEEDKESRGEPNLAHVCEVPPTAFISFVQTHDLIGNRLAGDRIYALMPRENVRAVMAVLLLVPQTPMLFMGDEFGASTPFPYFCDFHGELGAAVSKGRREFLRSLHNASDEALEAAPDPQVEETFLSAKLNWQEREEPEHADWVRWYTNILHVRHDKIAPLIGRLVRRCGAPRILAANAFEVAWTLKEGHTLRISANLRPAPFTGFTEPGEGAEEIWIEGAANSASELAAYSVRWTLR